MRHEIKTLAKNCHGQLGYCSNCNVYHLYFNNIYLELTPPELSAFGKFVAEIDVDHWESCCGRTLLKRKIPIQTMQQNLALMFNQQELSALKEIIFRHTAKPNMPITVSEIDYTTFLN